ncbi:MAG: hypothetical protein JNJ94_02765 [Chlorobi bacterium]|nr:hypothetical protein [Chlorobiota bacterium]
MESLITGYAIWYEKNAQGEFAKGILQLDFGRNRIITLTTMSYVEYGIWLTTLQHPEVYFVSPPGILAAKKAVPRTPSKRF